PGQFADDDGDCQEEVSIPFSVSDDCELFDNDGNLVVSIVSAELDAFAVDANNDGVIKANEFSSDANVMGNITNFGDGTFEFTGTFPIITSAMGDNILHAVRVLVEDGCGNQSSIIFEFDIIDCKGPAPVCINGLTVTLMPTPSGEGCEMAIWASDFEGSPITDCTGQDPDADLPFSDDPQVTSYAIYRAAFVEAQGADWAPDPNDTGLILNQDDEETTIVYIYAFDNEGNYDFCETYILVQDHSDCVMDATGTLTGVIATEYDETVEGVEVNLSGDMANTMTTGANGVYSLINLNVGGDYTVTPYHNSNHTNGVTTFDIVKISKHILAVQPLDSPYKRIAADANRSNTITTLDLIQIRKLILNVITEFPSNTSWRFVENSYDFPDVTNPWAEEFPEVSNFNNLNTTIANADFVAIKIGDVNGSAIANAQQGDDRTLNGRFDLEVDDMSLNAGNTYTVAVRGRNMAAVEGYQATLALNGLELVDIEYGVAQAGNFGLRYASEGMITTSWNQDFASTQRTTNEDVLFSLVVRATEDIELHDALSISSRYTVAEAYETASDGGTVMDVGIHFAPVSATGPEFALYQNVPNPFLVETFIGFNLPEDTEVTLTVTDVQGRVLHVINDNFAAGYNKLALTQDQIKTETGVLTYTLTAGEYTATKQMVVVK
ncbi:MAG: T9SS type A sorting domain-containing protein, partial [Bacteroidota bacterium]